MEYPEADVQTWAFDEHRIGLQPVVRRMWIEPGTEPILKVFPRNEWSYLYGFVQPKTGETFWLILPTITTELMALALEEFARHVGAGPSQRHVIVMDRAGWHVTPNLRIPEGIHLVFLPPYSPELQPAERLWQLADECIAQAPPTDIVDLEERLVQRCRELSRQRELISGLTNFQWWDAA